MSQSLSFPAHARAILRLGLPLIGSHLAQMSLHVTDTLMLGWYDVESLAAVSLGGSLYVIVFLVGSGFAWAVMPVVATAAASGQDRQVRRVTRMAMWLSLMFTALAIPFFLGSEPVLKAMGQAPEISALAADYLAIMGWGLFPALQVMVLKSYLSALEHTRAILLVTVGAAVLNGFVNYALIFGNWGAPELGVRGAALGSFIVAAASFLALALYAVRATPEHALFNRFWRPDRDALWRVFSLGWPIGLTSLAEAGLFSAAAIMMGWIGTIELAAHGIAIQLASLTFIVHVGFSQVATIRTGQAFGRRNLTDLKHGALVTGALAGVFALMTVVMFLTVPEFLIGLFLDPDDPDRAQVLSVGVGLLAIAALFQIADGGQVLALGLLRGVQDTRVPMVIAAIAYWPLGLGAAYVFGFTLGMGARGIWLGLVVGLGVAAVLMTLRFVKRGLRVAAG